VAVEELKQLGLTQPEVDAIERNNALRLMPRLATQTGAA